MWKRATIELTLKYSLLFVAFLWLFSGGIYAWVQRSLGQDYIEQVQSQVDTTYRPETAEYREEAAKAAANEAIDRFGNIIIAVNSAALLIVPFGAYWITRRTLEPRIQAHERQKQFVANASHELRTPLAILNGELELALKTRRTEAYYRKALTASKAEVARMIQLANQLLLLNKIDTRQNNRDSLNDTVELSDVLRRIEESLKKAAVQRGRSITLHDIHSGYTAIGNTQLVETAILNVVQNALNYSPAGSTINIEMRKAQDRWLEIRVENPGILSATETKKLFDRFYRARTSDGHEGSGLGLAISKSIVEIYGGSISVVCSNGLITVSLKFRRAR